MGSGFAFLFCPSPQTLGEHLLIKPGLFSDRHRVVPTSDIPPPDSPAVTGRPESSPLNPATPALAPPALPPLAPPAAVAALGRRFAGGAHQQLHQPQPYRIGWNVRPVLQIHPPHFRQLHHRAIPPLVQSFQWPARDGSPPPATAAPTPSSTDTEKSRRTTAHKTPPSV